LCVELPHYSMRDVLKRRAPDCAVDVLAYAAWYRICSWRTVLPARTGVAGSDGETHLSVRNLQVRGKKKKTKATLVALASSAWRVARPHPTLPHHHLPPAKICSPPGVTLAISPSTARYQRWKISAIKPPQIRVARGCTLPAASWAVARAANNAPPPPPYR